jgi:hypothetical protein
MPVQIKPLSKTQLVEYFNTYRDRFPDWAVEHEVTLTRMAWPIKQVVAFQALRSGAYRPSSVVAILPALGHCHVLSKWLDIKHREILPREHASKWAMVLEAMEQQFLPLIRKPLDVAEVVQLAEEEVVREKIENINYSCGLATLNACLGNQDRALWWCDRLEAQLSCLGRAPADWEMQKSAFTRQLRDAIRRGDAQALLQAPQV